MQHGPHRQRPPRRRTGQTFAFELAECQGFVTVNEFDNGQVGEVFITVAKQGSTLAGLCDALAVAVSLGLQHGVPLAMFVRHLAHTRFAPAGRTDDPQLPTATSLADYVFQRLALGYLCDTDRAEILIAAMRAQATEAGLPAPAEPAVGDARKAQAGT
jgi:ribonucleoside-diphosphate reductase alpha chain